MEVYLTQPPCRTASFGRVGDGVGSIRDDGFPYTGPESPPVCWYCVGTIFGVYSGMASIDAKPWRVDLTDDEHALRAARERLWEIERCPKPLGRVLGGPRTIREMLASMKLMEDSVRPPEPPPEPRVATKRVRGVRRDFSGARKSVAWMDSDPCAYCGETGDTYDHITPRKRGGGHDDGNLVRACSSCNYEKSSRELLMFLTLRAQKKQDGTWTKRAPMSPHFRAIAGRTNKRQ